ncbi:hypothetical protein [Tissierella praeacuta]|uniref:hypothetical protein n=1 Tax=Tissierella praeacuta TaxID=43131 RepID=UPI003342B68D
MDIPKGMIQYSDSFHNTFGIYTYMIAQTLPPDYLILTVLPTITIKEYIEDIDKHFKNIIGKSIDMRNVTNAIYDITAEVTDIIDKPLYMLEEEIDEMILDKKTNCDLNLINLNKKESIDIVINNIIERFS